MKARLSIILVMFVAAMLPAVAAAHTMGGSGHNSYNFWGAYWEKKSQPSVELQPGPNYAAAKDVGSILWNTGDKWSYYYKFCPPGGNNGGSLDLEGITNLSTTMLNVIDLNITNTGKTYVKDASLQLGIVGDFPNGTAFIASDHMISFSDNNLSWMSFSSGSSNSVTYSFHLAPGQTETFYLSFYLPPGENYVTSSGNLWYIVSFGGS